MESAHDPQRAPSNGGFGLTEMLVVLVIIAILMAIAVPLFSRAKADGVEKQTQAAALEYDQALSEYASDSGNTYPVFGGPYWPSANGGPLNPITMKPYLRGEVPSILTVGGPHSATLGTSFSGGSDGSIVYTTNGGAAPTRYTLAVYFQGVGVCYTGNGGPAPTGTPPAGGWVACN